MLGFSSKECVVDGVVLNFIRVDEDKDDIKGEDEDEDEDIKGEDEDDDIKGEDEDIKGEDDNV